MNWSGQLGAMSGYQLSPFDVGQVEAHLQHGLKAAEIARVLVKSGGVSTWSDNAIKHVVDKLEAKPRMARRAWARFGRAEEDNEATIQ